MLSFRGSPIRYAAASPLFFQDCFSLCRPPLVLALGTSFVLEVIIFFLVGFCITGLTPVAYQYGAEITHPAPEGTSNGIFALVVQASGFLILLMDALKDSFNGSYMPSIIGLAVLLAMSGVLLFLVKESPLMRQGPPAQKRANDLAPHCCWPLSGRGLISWSFGLLPAGFTAGFWLLGAALTSRVRRSGRWRPRGSCGSALHGRSRLCHLRFRGRDWRC